MRAIILVGGEGTRLRPLTLSRPKALMPVVGRPLLEWMLLWLKQHGVKEVLLTLCYQPDPIKRVFGSGKSHGMRIEYIHETHPLGTGGAIRNAAHFIKDTTLVLNGDVLMNVDLRKVLAFHRRQRALTTITLVRVEDPTAYGLVRSDRRSRVTEFLEKPSLEEIGRTSEAFISAGAYVMEPETVTEIPVGVNSSVERDVFPKLLAKKLPFFAYRDMARGYWIDVGTPQRYRMVQEDILHSRYQALIPGRKIRPGVWVHAEATIERDVSLGTAVYVGKGAHVKSHAAVGDSTVIGDGVVLEAGSVVAGSILMDGVVVSRGARVLNSIIGPHVRIGEFASVEREALLGEGSRVSSYSRI